MSDKDLIPLSEEQAKLWREIIAASRDIGGYLTSILDDLPKDLVGLLVGDRVKVLRAQRLASLWAKAKRRLQDRGIEQPEPPSLKLALPILAAAADENREELQDLWERLLAAAMDPKRQGFVRQSLISTVKQMDPFDVLVLRTVYDNPSGSWTPSGRDFMVSRFQSSQEEVLVSFDNLAKLNCIAFASAPNINPLMAPLGRLLMRAVAN
jgi:abortive infection alpha-like protein